MFDLSGGESLREHLVWRKNMDKVIKGLTLNTPIKKITAIEQLVYGTSLTSFRKGQKDSLETLWMVKREREPPMPFMVPYLVTKSEWKPLKLRYLNRNYVNKTS